MIIINNFKKYYKNKLILDINQFHFNRNNSYLIVGYNGSGKSTLIKCILGINSITFGNIKVNTNNIGYVPEKYYFPEFCSIDKFLKTIMNLYQNDNYKQIDYFCDLFNIDKRKQISKLSKGMQQKVLIIQSLIHNADLFIFDEPLNGLDPSSQQLFFNIINNLKKENKTIVITTHYPRFYNNNYDYYIKIENYGLKYENS